MTYFSQKRKIQASKTIGRCRRDYASFVSGSFACGSVERFHQAAKLPLQTYEADFFHALSVMETLKANRCVANPEEKQKVLDSTPLGCYNIPV